MIAALPLAFYAALGLVVGSFVATAAIRHARGEAFVTGRSACDHCGEPLRWRSTTPLLAYAGARGRSACCGERIDPLHPAGEAIGAAIVLAAILSRGPIEVVIVVALGMVLLALAVIDLKTRRLPNTLVAAVALLCAALAAVAGRPVEGLISGALSFAGLYALAWLSARKSGQAALGLGDVKLFAALALWLGMLSPFALTLAALIGLAQAAVQGLGRGERIAFGPHIAFAGFAVGVGAPWLEGLVR